VPEGATKGQTMVLFALMITALIGMLALSLDLGFGLVQRRTAQNFADASAMAGAAPL